MAPDLNSVPSSPRRFASTNHSTAASRRASQTAHVPVMPHSGGLESQDPYAAPAIQSTSTSMTSGQGVNIGPGPVRHPRPFTAAELHHELEKEQEAVVNRLTRELSLLRQQTASAVSNASSTSNGTAEAGEHAGHIITGPTHPTSTRRHRSSSNLSSQSVSLSALNSSTVSGIAPARGAAAQASTQIRGHSSRHDSMASRRSDIPSPLAPSLPLGESRPGSASARQNSASTPINPGVTPQHTQASSPPDGRSPIGTLSASSHRLEEVAHHRAELEAVRRENEALRQRVRELERQLQSNDQPADVIEEDRGR